MTTIVTRIGKGSALTFEEGDANFTNLNTDKLEDITNESVGDLSDVDITGIVNGEILVWDAVNSKFTAGNTGVTTGSVTAVDTVRNPNTVTLNNTSGVNVGKEIIFSGVDVSSAGLTPDTSYWIAADALGGAYELSDDPQGTNILTLSDPGTITDFTYTVYLEPRYARLDSLEDTNINSPSQDQVLQYINGNWENQTFSLTQLNATLDANDQQIQNANLVGYREVIHQFGTTSGTISPDAANGNLQKITLNGNITIDGFTNALAGQSVTLIIDNGTGGYTLNTNTMMFSNSGDLTLTGNPNSIDVLTIMFDGSDYYASLGKDFY